MIDKETLRTAWRMKLADLEAAPQWGRAAEKMRHLPVYRTNETIFAAPGESLRQIRINCLADGKNLVMPGPSLRQGFFILPARTVPFKNIAAAVDYKGLEKYGQLLKEERMSRLSVGLLLTGSLALDLNGGRRGDGNGYFDLCCALLSELGSLHPRWSAWSFCLEDQISADPLPRDRWDIQITGAVTPEKIHSFPPSEQQPHIFRYALPADRIKRIDPLYKLLQEKL
jgi:5-formyltetrahydrofolate cyclo-ligase